MQITLGPYRRSLTRYESARAYALLGVIAGVASGLAVIGFEQAIDRVARLFGVANGGEGFEALPPQLRFAMPVAGATLLGLLFALLREEDRETGIVHVISRLNNSYGVLPWRNALVQFIGGASLLASGQSGGREGPGVHLGGAATSLLGQSLSLPHNSLRVLIACGTAGGIAAAFHTPLAGVIFAMEVIICEYTVAGFLPVMLAAVCAAALSDQLGGGYELFDLTGLEVASLWDVPAIVGLGLCCGIAAAMFVNLSTRTAQLTHWPVALRFLLAGLLTGCLGIYVPEVLGVGYDTLGDILHGHPTATALLLIAGVKLFATAISVGLGMPLGLIGPSLLIGACIGAFIGAVGPGHYELLSDDASLYATIGMAACMGAVFAAPLAATLAVIELTQSTSVATPAMLAIVVAHLTNLTLFRQRAVHQGILRQQQRRLPDEPLSQLLHRTDISTILDSSVVQLEERLTWAEHRALQLQVPNWCLVSRRGEDLFLVAGGDLVRWVENNLAGEGEDRQVDVTTSDLRRWSIATLPEQATLRQALDMLRKHTAEAVCIYGRSGRRRQLRGVVTLDAIERFALAQLER